MKDLPGWRNRTGAVLRSVCLAASVWLAGCKVGPDYHQPAALASMLAAFDPDLGHASPEANLRKAIRLTERLPHGVVGVISPWNYPMFLPLSSGLPALLCGNAVVNKPSEWTPGIADLVAECLHEAGVPTDIYQVVHGAGPTGAALCEEVDKVFFTGSEATGRKVALACARRLIPCALELGGSDPAIVLADANLQHAASGIAWARFSNAGQTCVAVKRVFVEASVYDDFLTALTKAVGQLKVGPGISDATDVGPMIRPEQRATIAVQHADAMARGAREALRLETPPGDCYFPPTILTDVPADSRAMTEETFGPLLPVTKVRDVEEAIARANATAQGLSASVWTGDVARGVAVAQRLQAGSAPASGRP